MRAKTFLATAGLVLALTSSIASADTMSATELKKMAPGRYTVDIMGGMVSMVVTLYPNGRMAGTSKGQNDTGIWSVRGQQMCVSWSKWLAGSSHCSSLDKQGSTLKGSSFTIKHI